MNLDVSLSHTFKGMWLFSYTGLCTFLDLSLVWVNDRTLSGTPAFKKNIIFLTKTRKRYKLLWSRIWVCFSAEGQILKQIFQVLSSSTVACYRLPQVCLGYAVFHKPSVCIKWTGNTFIDITWNGSLAGKQAEGFKKTGFT